MKDRRDHKRLPERFRHLSLRAFLATAPPRFLRDESGSILVFAMIMITLMLMTSGMAIDLMRYEMKRTKVQNELDTATLAAANLNQTRDPTTVVNDYMTAAGVGDLVSTVDVQQGLGYRTVAADADVSIRTYFMKMMGIDTLGAVSGSTAQEKIGDVEIALALDVSGSMGQNSKIQNLRVAAQQFIDTMFNSVSPGQLSISVIPYAAQANVGADMLQAMGVTRNQTNSDCVDFKPADFTTTAVSTTGGQTQAGSFDPYDRAAPPADGNLVCPPDSDTKRTSLTFSGDQTKLDTFVNGLSANGNTSIDIGVKWAAATLDPSMRPVVSSFITAGKSLPDFAGRPADFSDHSTMKVIVVMTDGENTQRAEIGDAYRAGPSIVWRNTQDGSYSIYDAAMGSTPYWSQSTNSWREAPWGNGSSQQCTTSGGGGHGGHGSHGGGTTTCSMVADAKGPAVQMTWPEVWQAMSTDWFAYNLIYKAYGSSSQYYAWSDKLLNVIQPGTMDSNLHDICAAAKDNGIIIYSIGFETSKQGAAVLTDCATTPSYYFGVKGLQISSAFASIASNINRLRLVQ
ncbi:MAG: hypothetical protein GC186_07650 [Rhodobacteraceae bacterium]|nr:hypothetical protein [Paracoccaceae bacterium]